MKRYYEAKGEIRQKIIDWDLRSQGAAKRMLAFAKRHGSESIGVSVGHSTSFCLEKRTKNEGGGVTKFLPLKNDELWRLTRKDAENSWVPRLSIKAGKALHEEMQEIASTHPSRNELTKAIGGNPNPIFDGGLVFHYPSYRIIGKRVVVSYGHPHFKPKDPKQLVRISDVEFERLTAEKKPRKKAVAK